MPQNDDSIVDALNSFMNDKFSELHTCMPGKIEKYEYANQKAEVKPLLKRALKNGTQLEYPVITDVPVMFPNTGKTGITFPLVKGDYVLLVFAEKSINNWAVSGDDSDTEKFRLHNLSDAIAIPGIMPFNNASVSENNEDVVIVNDSQKITIKANGDIEVGTGSLLEPLKKLVTEAFLTSYNTHTHICAAAGSPSAVPIPLMDTTHLTSKVQAQ